MARGSYGLQRIVTLANGVTDGLLSAALWSKLSALLGINSVTLPLRLTGSALSVDAATTGAAGSMSAADKAKLDAATSVNTASALMQRDVNGDVAARTFVGTASAAATASALTAGTADGNKLHNLVITDNFPVNGLGTTWTGRPLADGARVYTTAFTVNLTSAIDLLLATVSLPDGIGLTMANASVQVTHLCTNGQQINTALRGAGGAGFNPADTAFQITARSVDGAALNTKDSTIRVYVTCVPI